MALPAEEPQSPRLRLIATAHDAREQSDAQHEVSADKRAERVSSVEASRARFSEIETTTSDAEWVGRLLQGEPEAFEALYRRHSSRVLALAIRIQGHGADVEDIVHDAFLKAQEKLGSLRDPHRFGSWVCTIAVSLIRTRMRRRRMMSLLGLAGNDEFDLESVVSPEAGPEVRSQISRAYLLVNQLSIEERICWTLRYVEGHRLQDVAQLAQCSLATAKRRIAQAQAQIQSELGEEEQG